jgi:cellulose synthase/poly-beta-1,6-N-acetylglucosamine synthase-like glycosyltransferase
MKRAAARRPLLGPWTVLGVAALLLALTMAVVELFMRLGLGAYAAPSLHLVALFVGYDLAVGGLVLLAAARRFALERAADRAGDDPGPLPAVSVLVAAYNEAGGIAATVRELARQRGLVFDVWVGDDGSTDGTTEALVAAFELQPARDGQLHEGWLREDGGAASAVAIHVLRLPHRGKGATLNTLASHAPHPVLLTVDADTRPADLALARMAAAFVDPDVDSAAGMVIVRHPRSWLTRHQAAEYLKTSVVRVGWSSLGALEQVPGAFAGLRATSFRAAGGFPTDSLTEDYEMTFRLVELGVRTGRFPVVVTVPGAKVFTDVPHTLRGFVRQRTRWFAGFLGTLTLYRHLIGRPGARAFGLVRLPLKLFDAILPLVAFGSLLVGLRDGFSTVLSISRVTIGLFALRWLWDLTFYGVALRISGAFRDPPTPALDYRAGFSGWMYTATEFLTYVWVKHAAVLRAYVWAARRIKKWEPSRETTPSLPASQAD